MRAAIAAEFARCRQVHPGPLECARGAAGIVKACGTEADDHVGVTAGDILAFAAIALGLELRFGWRSIADFAAQAAAVDRGRHQAFPVARLDRLYPAQMNSNCTLTRTMAATGGAKTGSGRKKSHKCNGR